MSIQQINNGDSGSKARATINSTARAVQLAAGGRQAIVSTFGDSVSTSTLAGAIRAAAWYWAPGLNIQLRGAYGVGGTSSSDLISGANPQLTRLQTDIANGAPLPDVAIIQTFSNDAFTGATAASLAQNQITFANALLTMGVPLVMVCSAVPKATGADQAGRMAINAIMRRYADVTPGVIFFDWFSEVVDPNAAGGGSATPWNPALQSYAADGVHPGAHACFIVGRVIAEVLSAIVGRVQPRTMLNVRYANTSEETRWHNLLGPEGNFQGTGGQLDGVDNTGVAGTSNTQNNRWQITSVSGLTIVPSIVTEPNGIRKQRMVVSGTPSANGSIRLRYNHNFLPVAEGVFAGQAIVDFTNIEGLNGIEFSTGVNGSVGVANSTTGPGSFPIHSGRWFMRTIDAAGLRNASSGAINFDVLFHVRSGVPMSGTIEVSRCLAFQQAATL